MAPKTNTLDLVLPVEFLRLGEMLSSTGSFRRTIVRNGGNQQASADEVEAIVDALLDKACKVPVLRRVLGLRQTMDRDAARIRLKVVAILAWQHLRASVHGVDIGDLAAACSDPKLPPTEGLLRARHEIGTMAVEDTIIGAADDAGVLDKVCLPAWSLEFLSGGKTSRGFLTTTKLSGILLPKGMDEYERPPANAPIPAASELRAKISEKVIGLDRQVAAISGLLVMHLARARLIRSGKDAGTNLATLLIGASGCGKTWMLETAGSIIGSPFASASATSMTSEAYIGGKIDDLFKALVLKAKGSVQDARFGIAFTDEWDAKASGQASGHASGGSGREVNTLCIQQEFLVPMQGAEFLISGKRAMERPIMFDSRGTFFAFAGVFDGLHEIIRKKNGQSCIGFVAPSGAKTKRQRYLLDAIHEYGYLRTWCNRITAVMFLPNPSAESLGRAAAHGILDGVNAVLGELGITLLPEPDAIPRMMEYAIESRTFYRGLKSVWWGIAEAAVAADAKGTVMVTGADVDAGIECVASGSVGLPEADAQGLGATATDGGLEDCNADNGHECASAGG